MFFTAPATGRSQSTSSSEHWQPWSGNRSGSQTRSLRCDSSQTMATFGGNFKMLKRMSWPKPPHMWKAVRTGTINKVLRLWQLVAASAQRDWSKNNRRWKNWSPPATLDLSVLWCSARTISFLMILLWFLLLFIFSFKQLIATSSCFSNINVISPSSSLSCLLSILEVTTLSFLAMTIRPDVQISREEGRQDTSTNS